MASGDVNSVDAMYMENLDEFINDENKVVTYRWLSTTLQVHVNQAKQMLYNFVMQQRNDNDKDNLNVTYFVSGLHKCDGSTKIQHCEVVSEDKLEAIKSTFQKLYSCHIYSVQKSKLQDSDALYITDYNLMKENIFESCKQSSIRYDAAKRVATSKPVVQEIKKEQITPSILDDNSRHRTLESKEKTTAPKKDNNKTGIAGMFAKANIKKDSSKNSEQIQNCSKTDTKETVKKNSSVSKKLTGVMSFFANSAAKNKPSEEKPSEEKPVSIKKESGDTKRTEEKKKPPSSDSDDDDFVKQKKKRRRIKEDLFDSSSEEEMEVEEPLSSPNPAAEEVEEEKDDDNDEEDDEAPIPDTPEQNIEKVKKEEPTSVTVTNDGRRRKRIKRKKKKNYLNDEGFMDMDQPANKESHPIRLSAEAKKSSASAKSVVDKGKQKQSSLMSFFSKNFFSFFFSFSFFFFFLFFSFFLFFLSFFSFLSFSFFFFSFFFFFFLFFSFFFFSFFLFFLSFFFFFFFSFSFFFSFFFFFLFLFFFLSLFLSFFFLSFSFSFFLFFFLSLFLSFSFSFFLFFFLSLFLSFSFSFFLFFFFFFLSFSFSFFLFLSFFFFSFFSFFLFFFLSLFSFSGTS
ncbi:POLD3 [Acanthosepion pharaonis]|uniref:DNA polymerase delta subunit 3 n=1 Tax=Acanthosepion pharaonis TaxID=158019 RepID=A0A812CJM3_ACAPH|nr:POLD3 [Sepia pharaonis]